MTKYPLLVFQLVLCTPDSSIPLVQLLCEFSDFVEPPSNLRFLRFDRFTAITQFVLKLLDPQTDGAAFLIEKRKLIVEPLLPATQFCKLRSDVFDNLIGLVQKLIFSIESIKAFLAD